MTVSRLAGMAPIGVDRMGDLADGAADPEMLRLENLDTDLRPPAGVEEATRAAVGRDDANSYLPFVGHDATRRAAAALVSRTSGVDYDWRTTTLISNGGLSGILDVLLALLEPGDEVVLVDPIYIGLVNRVRLAGGVPRFARCEVVDGVWRLDLGSLHAAVSERTRAFLMMSPAMPSGCVLRADEWRAVSDACRDADAWMIVDSAMERILFDDHERVHPASLSGMAERTITVGSVAKEYRMIGWRVGWIVAPPRIVDDIGLVTISNGCCSVGIAQSAAALALETPDGDVARAAAVWQRRRDVILRELRDYPVIRPEGGWSLLVDVAQMGLTGREASDRLMTKAKVAATPMDGWGSERSRGLLRLVFSNEPTERLEGLGARFDAAFADR
ncbi:MAG: pyridoxal phosphate-dependent aminotransferase [Acidobacteriota bacterium]